MKLYKKVLVQMTVFVGMVIFILIFTAAEAFVAKPHDLHKMVDVIHKNDGTVTEWTLFARDELAASTTVAELERIAHQWEQYFPQFTWKRETTDDRWLFQGTTKNQESHYHETLQIVADLKTTNLQGFVLYEMTGTNWNRDMVKATEEKTNSFLPHLFHQTPMIFSFVKGNFGDLPLAAYELANQLNEDFNGKVIEQLTENEFVSLTVNSPYFNNNLLSVKGSFNMQIAVRAGVAQAEEKLSFVIGTPILTVEY